MDEMIAYCGLVCTGCPAYIATQSDDDAEREKVATKWSSEFNADIKPEDINCDGCLASGIRLFSHAKVCEIRKCGTEHGVVNCGLCVDYPCETVKGVIDHLPDAKARLDGMKADIW
jgi:hypothetical protein